MFQTLPGTLLTRDQADLRSAYGVIEPILAITKGLTLSQIRELTGLENSTVQNWVKRGWVARPKSKRYGERQVMRIILINALRASLQLDRIVQLMQYVNGSVEDSSDDIIPDGALYDYLCAIVFQLEDSPVLDDRKIDEVIASHIADYQGPAADSREKLAKTLRIMTFACISSRLKQKAEMEMSAILGG
ncbi:MAG TPA: DUF1836 domain-containing protein [Candidatus Fimivicinus intestinavium]|nr:DUF1836 domain-containing protein [Candidatus Fimivicinus intestinavium]